MSFLTEHSRDELARQVVLMRENALSKREDALAIIADLQDVNKQYGVITVHINKLNIIRTKLQTIRAGLTIQDDIDEIDGYISQLGTVIVNLQNNYTNNIYNVIQGI